MRCCARARAASRRTAITPPATPWTSTFPASPLEKVREVGLRMQRGGVGFYPTSGSPFVHMDTGTIRHWPRMTYATAVQGIPRRTHRARAVRRPAAVRLCVGACRRRSGAAASRPTFRWPPRATPASSTPATAGKPKRSLSRQRCSAARQDRDSEIERRTDEQPAAAPKRTRAPVVLASAAPAAAKPVATERVVPLPSARPKVLAVAAATPKPAAAQIVTAASIADDRVRWTRA